MMSDMEKIPKPELASKSPQKTDKKGWMISEGGNKCLAEKPIQVTPEMEKRRVEVSRTHMADFIYITYRDPVTEVYWAEKTGAGKQ
jgi:hypothetical protein